MLITFAALAKSRAHFSIARYLLFRLFSLKDEACASRAICVRETLQVAFRLTASLQMNGGTCLLLLFISLVISTWPT